MKRIILASILLLTFIPTSSVNAFMTLPASDNFTRADASTLGTNWTQQEAALRIVSSHATGTTDLTYQYSFWNADAFNNNQYSEVTMGGNIGGDSSVVNGPTVRASGTGGSSQMYAMLCQGGGTNSTYLFYFNGSSPTQIGSTITGTAWTSGDVAHLEVSGTTFTLKRNGTTLSSSLTDSTLATGSAGFVMRNSGSGDVVTLWGGGNIGGGGGGTGPCTLGTLGVGKGCLLGLLNVNHLR